MAAAHSYAASERHFSALLFPAGTLDYFLNAFRVAVRGHAKIVYSARVRFERVEQSHFSGIEAETDGESIEHHFKTVPHVDRSVTAHRSACRLVGEHAIAVEFNVLYIVDCGKQRA